MNPKYKSLAYWSIAIWFILWGLISVLIVSSRPIPPINYCILIAGLCMMVYCAWNENNLFPPEEEKGRMKMQSQKIIKLKNRNIITTEELIKASEASLKKWSSQTITQFSTNNKCGFCLLMNSKNVYVSMSSEPGYPDRSPCFEPCPAGKICHTNVVFWDEIMMSDRKHFNPDKFKYQAKRIHKNIDWLKEYLKELRA